MSHAQMLSAVGLIRTSRRRGFCPACRLFQTGDGPQEISAPALISVAFLIVAAVAWTVTIARMSSMDDMTMGLGPIGPFVVAWTVMMAAMMFPSAMPLMFEFARNAERRRGYLLYHALGMPWPNQALVGGAALVIAGLYALTPFKRASEARCRELCAVHGPLPLNLMRSAMVAGGRYGLSCLGCSAGLMVAMVLIGLSNLIWMVALTAVILIYKLAPTPTLRWASALSAAVVALGVLYAGSASTPS
jgi:predicted metal-binding membrane protein